MAEPKFKIEETTTEKLEAKTDEPLYMMCAPADLVTPFDDNLETDCADGCGERLIYRPTSPKNAIKVCQRCMQIRMRAEEEKGESITLNVTTTQLAEIEANTGMKRQRRN
ncbi:hypothetical protein [Hyphomicrobium sp.]|uniref:hypothetical protein n=1 Tax=Hyphomicrobium sp. TaxID=82 RepID=UPI001D442E6F|nr:hypothetical protein [Hyphomicrobium sp.]MBY0559842.1 hypothetical protein [Hyphomicrobium sp.]